MKYIFGFIIISLLVIIWGYTPKWEDYEIEEIKEELVTKTYKLGDVLTEEEVKEIIIHYATGTKAYEMKRTIYCESGYKIIQSNVVKNGVREDSWGLAQIHLPSHPTVSKEQTLDPEFAIKFMSDNFYRVKWYGLDRVTDVCNPIYK
jgi:hypothetical protein